MSVLEAKRRSRLSIIIQGASISGNKSLKDLQAFHDYRIGIRFLIYVSDKVELL